jgi:hypothetical protein
MAAQICGTLQLDATGKLRAGIDGSPRGRVGFAPAAGVVEVLQRQSGWIDQAVATLAGRVRTMRLEPRTDGGGRFTFAY